MVDSASVGGQLGRKWLFHMSKPGSGPPAVRGRGTAIEDRLLTYFEVPWAPNDKTDFLFFTARRIDEFHKSLSVQALSPFIRICDGLFVRCFVVWCRSGHVPTVPLEQCNRKNPPGLSSVVCRASSIVSQYCAGVNLPFMPYCGFAISRSSQGCTKNSSLHYLEVSSVETLQVTYPSRC